MHGYALIAHLNRSNRYDTYEVWSEERLCSCVAKRPRADAPKKTSGDLRLEGERLVSLVHPHIVRGYEVLETDEGPTLIMETLDGETVAHLLKDKKLDADEVAWLGLQLASALQYLHGRGLLHLDVKPGNIIATGGRAVLIDLSMARPVGRYKRGLGTWCNLSPEQAKGEELSTAADVWGLGTVLLEAALGKPAFPQEEPEYPQLVFPPPPVPGPLGDVIAACLAFDPDDRPTLPELAAALLPHAPGARPWSDPCAATS